MSLPRLRAAANALAPLLPLSAGPASAAAAPSTPLLLPLRPALAHIQASFYARFTELAQMPGEARTLLGALGAWLRSAPAVEAFAYLLILFIVSVGLEWLYFTFAYSALKAADLAEADTPAGILWLGLRRLLLKGGGLVLFTVAALSVATSLDWPGSTQDVVLTALIVVVALRFAGLLVHLLLRPGSEGPRLLPLGPRASVWAAWGSLLLVGLLFVGWWVPDSIERVAGLDALAQTIRLVAATLATVLVLFAIARNGKAPKLQLRGSRRLPPIPIKFFASAAVLAVYLLWLGGAGQLAFTLAVIVVFAACERALYPMVRFFWPDFGQADAEFRVLPGLVLRVLRLGFACLGFVAILAAWNLPLMQMSMAESPAGRFLARILSALALILAADLAWALIKGAIDSRLNHLGPIELESGAPGPNARLVTLLPLLRMAIGVALSVLLVLSVLSVLGIEITPLLAGAGVVGIALGFGAQTLVRDVLSGVFYLVEDVFRLGEYIESGSNTKGTVERITLRSVALRHQNGPLHFVPYGTLGAVRNNSRDWIIEKFMLPLPTDVDSEFIRKMVRNIGQQMLSDADLAAVIVSPLKAVLYRIDPGVKLFRCKFQTLPGRQFEVRTVAYKRIEAELRKAGIPFAESASKVIVQDSSGARLPAPAASAPEKTAG